MVGIGMMGTACPKGFQKAISTFGLDKVHGRMGDGQGGGGETRCKGVVWEQRAVGGSSNHRVIQYAWLPPFGCCVLVAL